jgi:hypothetical protein
MITFKAEFPEKPRLPAMVSQFLLLDVKGTRSCIILIHSVKSAQEEFHV